VFILLLYSDRAILREIPLVFSQNNNDEDDDEEDGCLLEDEFRAFDDNKHFKEIKRQVFLSCLFL
jgi:hypothetical protein